MGKALIIKGANFSANAVDTLDEMYEDITDELINGFANPSSGKAVIYNASYNSSNALIPRFLILMASTTQLYDTHDKGVEWLIPSTMQFLPFAHKVSSTIGSNGLVSDSFIVSQGYMTKSTWITAEDIYTKLGVSQSTYPCYNGCFIKGGSDTTPLTVADAIALGVRVRRLKNV